MFCHKLVSIKVNSVIFSMLIGLIGFIGRKQGMQGILVSLNDVFTKIAFIGVTYD